jgi:hypothetical protein
MANRGVMRRIGPLGETLASLPGEVSAGIEIDRRSLTANEDDREV